MKRELKSSGILFISLSRLYEGQKIPYMKRGLTLRYMYISKWLLRMRCHKGKKETLVKTLQNASLVLKRHQVTR